MQKIIYTRGFISFFLILIITFTIVGLIGYVAWNKISTNSVVLDSIKIPQDISELETQILPTPTTQVAFYELTIPYLRNREYKSNLTDLARYSESPGYTSYLTTYDSDGFAINGLITIPKGQMPQNGWPAIVFVHGYIAPTIYRTTERYSDYVNYLARNGFVVFKIDLRGHGDSEGEAGGAYYSSDYVIDTLNAYSALQNSEYVDSTKIGLWGHSMAGNVVSRALAARPSIPAVVIWAGAGYTYTDLQAYRINDQSYRPPDQNTVRARKRAELRAAHGDFDPNNAFWKTVPFTNYLSDIKGAIQIHHAVDDNVVSVEYARNLGNILGGTSIIHEIIEYESGGHNLSGNAFGKAMESSISFFNQNF